MSTTTPTSRGLEDIVAGSSAICYIDGTNGVLAYRGIDIHDLADNATFEEVTYLLWHGKLPTRKELAEFSLQLVRERKLDAQIISFLRQVPKHALPMDVCRTIVSALAFFDPEEKVNTKEANYHKAERLFSQTGMIVASYDRIRKGLPLIEPDRSLSYAGNFLLMLNGVRPSETAIRALDIFADSDRRPRVERLHLCGARNGGHAERHAFGGHLRHRRPEGTAARRRQRSGDEDAGGRSTSAALIRWNTSRA